MPSSITNKVFALSFGKAFTSIIALVSGMVLSRVLSIHDYATYRQTLLIYAVAVPILSFGLPDAVYFFLGDEQKRKRGLVVDNLILLLVVGIVFAMFLLFGGNELIAKRFNNPDIASTLKVFSLYALASLPLATLSAVMLIQNKIKQLLTFNIASRLLLFGGLVTVAFVYTNALSLIYVEVITSFIVFAGILVMLAFSLPNDSITPSITNIKRMLIYSIPLGFTSMLGTISVQLHQIIVSSICTPADYAVYANGAIEIPVIGMITGSIATVILVEMRQSISNGDTKNALSVFQKATLPSSVILIPLMFFLLIQAKPFIETLFSEKYSNSVNVFRIYLLILPARIVYYGSALMAFGLTKILLIRSALSLLFNAIVATLMVYFFGYLGAIIGFLFILYLWDVAFNFYILAKNFNCVWYKLLPIKQIGMVFLLSAGTSIIIFPFLFIHMNKVLSLVCSACLFFPIVFLLLHRFNLLQINWISSNLPISWQKYLNSYTKST